ncbi:MAG TPA: hypothetical protein PK586_15120 [Casimicrobium sp.]|nr:hypothetical protein [Casimicrobium sp.]
MKLRISGVVVAGLLRQFLGLSAIVHDKADAVTYGGADIFRVMKALLVLAS